MLGHFSSSRKIGNQNETSKGETWVSFTSWRMLWTRRTDAERESHRLICQRIGTGTGNRFSTGSRRFQVNHITGEGDVGGAGRPGGWCRCLPSFIVVDDVNANSRFTGVFVDREFGLEIWKTYHSLTRSMSILYYILIRPMAEKSERIDDYAKQWNISLMILNWNTSLRNFFCRKLGVKTMK